MGAFTSRGIVAKHSKNEQTQTTSTPANGGRKIFGPDGFKLPDAQEAEIERLLEGHELDEARVTGAAIGRAVKIEDSRGRYVVFCKGTFPNRLSLDGIKMVVDAAHGAAYVVAP